MSFTSSIKSEISLDLSKVETVSFLSAIIKNIGVISDSLKITTENASVAKMLYTCLKENYGSYIKVTVRRGFNFKKSYLYILEIKDYEKIISNLDLSDCPKYLVEDDVKKAYLKGLFLSCGSINDPKKSRYHLELLVDNKKYAGFIMSLFNEFFLNSKVLKRENKYMIYIKEAEKIADFLRIINAVNGLLYYENIRIFRESKNMTNRLNNCEQANVDRMIMTSSKQIKDIEIIKENDMYDLLDDKLKVVIDYRLKYPEVSLQELSEIMSIELDKKITKSGLNHRFNKIKEVATKLKK